MESISPGFGSEFRFQTTKWGVIRKGYSTFQDGDVAFAKITPCFQNRKSVIFEDLPNGIGAGTTELKTMRVYGQTLYQKFLLLFLQSPYFIDGATFKGTANQQRIISGYLENILFPLPPLGEQNRIIKKMKILFDVLK